MEYATIGKIEPEHFRNFTQINLGDATMLATLDSLGKGRSVVMLDQNTEVSELLLDELRSGRPAFSFLETEKKYRYEYASIYEKVLKDERLAAEMREVYRNAWRMAKPNLGNLTLIGSSIESAVDELQKPRPVADLITYYYPSPQYSPIFKTFELASMLLKPGGEFIVASENSDVISDFAHYAGKFAVRSGYVKRSGGQYLSAYDIAWGQKGHYEVRIKNIDNQLHTQVSTIKKGAMFRAMSALGMVR